MQKSKISYTFAGKFLVENRATICGCHLPNSFNHNLKIMLRSLSQIFPSGYPHIPTVEELKCMVKDMLCHCDSTHTILHYLQQIKCPYYQEALTIQTQHSWHELEQEHKEPAVYLDMEGMWHYSWIDIDSALRVIIKKAHALQIELESQANTPTDLPTAEPPQSTEPSQSTEPHIQHVGVMYSHCTIYQLASPSEPPSNAEKQPASTSNTANEYPTFYRTDAQSITTIEKHFKKAMSYATKTKCIRYLMEHSHKDGCFKFSDMTYLERANALNHVQDKHHFTAGDFENAAHKIQRN